MGHACKIGFSECTGCMTCEPDEPVYCCPDCGEELGDCDDLITDDGVAIGCEHCKGKVTAHEYFSSAS